ncbi:MAG: hypothetical protein WA952_02100 [Lewinella sp.]
MKHHYLALFSFLIMLSACGNPLQVVRVSPAAEEDVDRYRYGNPVQSQSQEDVAVEVSYYDASADYLVFDAEVLNSSAEDILFDPAETYLRFPAGFTLPAIDPEFQLLTMDLETVSRQRTARTLAWAGAAVMVASTVYAVANANAPTFETTTTASVVADLGLQVADAMTFAVINQNQDNYQRHYIPADAEIPGPENRFFWLDHSFRKTTLRPGESAVGKLVFPRSDEHLEFQVAVPVEGREPFTFDFTQRIFRDRR